MTTENTKTPPTPATTPKRFEENTVDQVLANINKLQELGDLKLPPDYSAENAVRSAWLMIQEVVDTNKKKALDVCTKPSIANAMLDMVLQGLSPVKKQCYFIVYGDKLQLSRSYIGTLAVAKRVAEVDYAVANVIYEGDEFQFEINNETGRKKIVSHTQSIDSIDMEKIKGVYATVTMLDGSHYVEIMTMKQVRTAWSQGAAKGDSPAHRKFPDEMAKKSCIGRALKLLIGGSDDNGLFDEDEAGDPVAANVSHQIATGANKSTLSISNPPPKKATPLVQREYTQPEPEAAPPEEQPAQEETAPY